MTQSVSSAIGEIMTLADFHTCKKMTASLYTHDCVGLRLIVEVKRFQVPWVKVGEIKTKRLV